MSNYLQQLAGAAHRWRWELQVQSDPPVTYQLGTFSGDLVSLDFRSLPPIPEGVEFRLVAMPVMDEEIHTCHAGAGKSWPELEPLWSGLAKTAGFLLPGLDRLQEIEAGILDDGRGEEGWFCPIGSSSRYTEITYNELLALVRFAQRGSLGA